MLLSMEQSARILGISVDRLHQLRSENEIFGYRDGPTWKFKLSELERVSGDIEELSFKWFDSVWYWHEEGF